MPSVRKNDAKPDRPLRYAVVGQGYISQVAVLPAFEHAKKNSELAAIISDDPVKLQKLAKKYKVESTYPYERYDECLRSGSVEAVYIALPNNMHREYAVRAARAGVHVLCEKPMAVTEAECEEMIRAAEDNRIKLMIAYRLHFEEANLKAVDIVQSGKLGEPRYFSSQFSLQVQEGNIRLFQAEPTEVFAFSANNGGPRFHEVDEMSSATRRFPGERLASFVSSFGAADVSAYGVVGTKGGLGVDRRSSMNRLKRVSR